MGIKKWIVQKGTIGSTARTVAKWYLALIAKHPTMGIVDLSKALIISRYALMPNSAHESTLLTLAETVDNLSILVEFILIVEAGFSEMALDDKELCREVIKEELLKYNIPQNIIFNSTR
jgi:hypothetical protein